MRANLFCCQLLSQRLTECWVEQDFYSRYHQLKPGNPQPVDSSGLDPGMTPIVPSSQAALDVGRKWLETFDLATAGEIRFDNSVADPNWELVVKPEQVEITDVFSVGNKVPFHTALTGPMQVGESDDQATLLVCGILTI